MSSRLPYRRARVALAAERARGVAPPADDLPGNIWEVVLLAAGPANGLLFTGEALARAAPLFAGRPVFVDHALPAEALRPGGRSLRDLAGRVLAARWDGAHGLLCGRVGLLPGALWLAELARQCADAPWFGLSADVWLVSAEPPRGERAHAAPALVERIVRVNSVDMVVNPAGQTHTRHFGAPSKGLIIPDGDIDPLCGANCALITIFRALGGGKNRVCVCPGEPGRRWPVRATCEHCQGVCHERANPHSAPQRGHQPRAGGAAPPG